LMPRMDGYRLCYEIRKNPTFDPIPFIAYSANYTSPLDEKAALNFGADKFIRKPASSEVIIRAVRDAVDSRSISASHLQPPDESLAMREYSETLVRKLEQTNLELAETNNMLAQSENHVRTILESAPECIKIVDGEGLLVEINRAGLAMIEADFAEQVLGKSVYPLIVPEHQQAFREVTQAVLRGESRRLEFEMVGLKGARRWLETHAVPFKNANGDTISSLGITRDISESKRAGEIMSKIFPEKVRHRRGAVFAELSAIFGLSAVVFGVSAYLELFQNLSERILKAYLFVHETIATLVFLAFASALFS